MAAALDAVWYPPVTIAASGAEKVGRFNAQLAVARADLTGSMLLIEHLKAQLAVLSRMRFGRALEKLTAEITNLDLLLEDLEGGEAERVSPRGSSRSSET